MSGRLEDLCLCMSVYVFYLLGGGEGASSFQTYISRENGMINPHTLIPQIQLLPTL